MTNNKIFKISKDIFAIDLFLYLKKHNVLIISDIHIGYEELLNKNGILIPRTNYSDLILRIEKSISLILKTYSLKKIDKIILNGDLLHEFSKINFNVKTKLNEFISLMSSYSDVIIIEGNHDKTLKFIVALPVLKELILEDVLVIHGDKLMDEKTDSAKYKKIKTIIIGHEHPAVTIKSGIRSEKFKCFLRGTYSNGAGIFSKNNKNLIVTPSCNLSTDGTDVLRERLLSPYLKNNKKLPDFEVFIVEDEIYDFGKLKKLVNE